MQQEVFRTETFTTATEPPHHLGERWSSRVQQTEAGSANRSLAMWQPPGHPFMFPTGQQKANQPSNSTSLTNNRSLKPCQKVQAVSRVSAAMGVSISTRRESTKAGFVMSAQL
ncbi:unnamed protein product [Pleuronectes platessa]|uniref:Uncharacterized protein n=1 Tax=Pleuronectes platessa TaxID=8262 RepID=A0A9N7YRU7_PLEPL|nr:unnamed protein product [Pleuronectes platessa]